MPKSRSGNPAVRAAAEQQSRTNPDALAILWASNSPHATTGYGQQTAQAIRRLAADGHHVAVASNYGLEGAVSTWEGMRVYPRGFDLHSSDVIPAYYHAWAHDNAPMPTLLVTLYDVWVYQGKHWDTVENIASWVPVDHFPVPPKVAAWCRKPSVTPIAMSRFGEHELTEAGIDCLYVPHGIDTGVFRRTESFASANGPMTGREFMGIPEDAFVVGMVSANKGRVPNRKSFPEAFTAFSVFLREHPDAYLYVHTEHRGGMGGLNLERLALRCGIPAGRVVFPDPFVWRMGIPNEVLASLYSAMDVFLQPSMGEGFGIPLVEAQACGVPAIVSNATAQPELLGDGWLVEGQPWWDEDQESWLFQPRVESIAGALMAAYERPRGPSDEARDFAQQYDADFVFDTYWRPALKVLAP